VVDQHSEVLIARYGELLDSDTIDLDCIDQLSDVVVETLVRFGVPARRSRPGMITSARTIALPFASMNMSLEIAGVDEPLTLQQVTDVSARVTPNLRVAILSMRGYAEDALDVGGDVVLLDRHHLEAILAGLLNPQALLAEAVQNATFDDQSYTSLTSILVIQEPAQPPQCAPPDRVPPPWELVEEVANEARVRQILGGRPGWPEMTGMAALDEQRLLLTTAQGLIEIHVRRGTTHWFLAMERLHGAPLVQADGSVIVMCHDAVIRCRDGQITPIAGGLQGAVDLSADRDGAAWVLSGTGTRFDDVANIRLLTRIGDDFGHQQTYNVAFGASVHGMAWLQGRSFFLAAGSHSGVVNLSRSSVVQPADQVRSEQSYPEHVIALDSKNVLTGSTDGRGVSATIYRTDLLRRSTALMTRLRLNKIQGLAATPGHVYILGDVRGNDHLRPQPVILKATFPHQAPPSEEGTPKPLNNVRLVAKGNRKDYALDAVPIADGAQATVFSARHRASQIPVAFKRLKLKSPENIARLRYEVEAGQRFGDNPHVVPVLDFDPAAGWFVMPLADGNADEAREEFEHPQQLIELIAAICDGLRVPHHLGWVHRDLKPANVLKLGGVWAIADWGLGRRPRGRTSHPGRTQIGVLYGTAGFAAPELSDDAHQAGPQADIYSLGQIIGWALTGRWPKANRPLLPPDKPWRSIVGELTRDDPADRPATVDEVLALMDSALPVSQRRPADLGRMAPAAHQRVAAMEPERQSAAAPAVNPAAFLALSNEPLIVEGLLGRIEFDGEVVTIVKNGYGAEMKGRRAVDVSQIDTVILKSATRWNHGYLQIIVRGRPPVPEQRGLFLGGRPPMQDSLSVSFAHRANPEATRMKASIDASLGRTGSA
jgi:serine/threonine protein kinase